MRAHVQLSLELAHKMSVDYQLSEDDLEHSTVPATRRSPGLRRSRYPTLAGTHIAAPAKFMGAHNKRSVKTGNIRMTCTPMRISIPQPRSKRVPDAFAKTDVVRESAHVQLLVDCVQKVALPLTGTACAVTPHMS
jgi:hypothetical protein